MIVVVARDGIQAALLAAREMAVPEFPPVSTIEDFRTLDEADVLLGYMDGFDGAAAPGSDRSRSYWHGWRNGMVDSGRCSPDDAQHALAALFGLLGSHLLH